LPRSFLFGGKGLMRHLFRCRYHWLISHYNFPPAGGGGMNDYVREVGQLTLMPNGQERPGSIIGTAGYASPEQCAMFPTPVLASDIYAVGSIGIQAMTGLPPSMIITPFEEIPRWWEVPDRSNATPEFTEILNKMLIFSPKARYYDASAALEALRTITAKYPSADVNQTIKVSSVPIQQRSTALPSVVAQPKTVAPTIEISQIPKFVNHAGILSQEVFKFETAKLEKISVQKIELVKRPGWFFRKKEEQVTELVEKLLEWEVKKSYGQAERFIENLGRDIELEMVYVPGESFTMGSEEYDNEKPRHVVMVPSFYMSKFQVTQGQYLQIMGTNPAKWNDAKLPVERISWNDAQVFCQKLSAKTGKKYRLPSEAEWEYACRAKTDTPFYFGETISTDVANYDGNHVYKLGVKGVYRSNTTPMGSFPANGFGLQDMHGNLWEWCEDKWHENYQGAPTNGSAWTSSNDNNSQSVRLLRGGSWGSYPGNCRSARRTRRSAGSRNLDIGFRIVCAQDL
jgi:eukaryotic-like serine/threonine-protein kinase